MVLPKGNKNTEEINMKKGTVLIAKTSEKVYQIVGCWGKDIVLAPIHDDDDQVVIYTKTELEDFIESGNFRKLKPVNIDIEFEEEGLKENGVKTNE